MEDHPCNIEYFGEYLRYFSDFQSTDQLVIEGPVRIYWGVDQPIRLQEFDNVPSVPSPTSWRHSFIPGDKIPDIKPDLRVRFLYLYDRPILKCKTH